MLQVAFHLQKIDFDKNRKNFSSVFSDHKVSIMCCYILLRFSCKDLWGKTKKNACYPVHKFNKYLLDLCDLVQWISAQPGNYQHEVLL